MVSINLHGRVERGETAAWKAERKRKERKLTAGQPSVSPVSATEDEAEVEGLWFDGGEQESMGTSTEKTNQAWLSHGVRMGVGPRWRQHHRHHWEHF